MSVSETQKNLLEAMRIMSGDSSNSPSGPQIQVGVVAEDPKGYKCIVKIQGTEKTCTLPEHLHDWISKDDIVFVTDLYGNESNLVVTGSSGSIKGQTLVVNDEEKNKLSGGVTKFEDENGNLTDNDLTVEKEG